VSEREKSDERKINIEQAKDISELDAVDEMELINELFQAKSRSLDMPIPNELNDYIQKGLAKGIKVGKTRRLRKWSTLVACCLLAVFITVVRVSPVVAAVLHQIPGLGYIVELINYDKGLQSSVKNDFIQPIGVSDEHENVVFTVDGIIMDESSLVIFYTVENKRGHGKVDFSEVQLLDEVGEPVRDVSISSYSSESPDKGGDGKVQSQFNVNFDDHTVIPNRLFLKVKLGENGKLPEIIKPSEEIQDNHPALPTQLSSTWEVTIPMDKNKFAGMKTVYEVN